MPRRPVRQPWRVVGVAERSRMIRVVSEVLRVAVGYRRPVRDVAAFKRRVLGGHCFSRVVMGLALGLRAHGRLRRHHGLRQLLRALQSGRRRLWVTEALRDGFALYAMMRRISMPRADLCRCPMSIRMCVQF